MTKRQFTALAIGACFACSLAGCRRLDIRITTYLSHELSFPPPIEMNSVAVVAETTPREPLLEQEVGRKIEVLLTQRGYPVKSVGDAKYVLFAFFSVDSGNTATGTYNTYVPGGTAYTNVQTSNGQWATAQTQLPGQNVQRSYNYTYFRRYLGVTLYDKGRHAVSTAEAKDDAVVWRATTTSAGGSSDLRSVIDYLLLTTFDLYGIDTGKQVRKSVFEGDKRAEALRESARAVDQP